MRVKILKKYWTVRFVAHLGGDHADIDKNTHEIRLLHNERGREFLDSLIHEMIHAAGWHIDEDEFVAPFATDLARVIMRKEFWRRITEAPE
jgi:hypothetical protein